MTTPPAGPARDETAFDAALDRHRRELHVHCYRMLGSYTDAEDAVQDTMLRAWRHRDQLASPSTLRPWLYRIATNCCIDLLQHRSRRGAPGGSLDDPLAELGRLQPCPATLLDTHDGMDAAAVARETVELAFIAALAHLPVRQRAVLIMRDVLGWTAEETAEVLELTVVTVNSLGQRARDGLRRRIPADRSQWRPARVTAEERAVLDRYMAAHERGDAAGLVGLLREEIRITMPPEAPCHGVDQARQFAAAILGRERPGDWRLVPLVLNGHPATANYVRRSGEQMFRPLSIDVLRVAGGRIAEINCFLGTALFPRFGLPAELSRSDSGVHPDDGAHRDQVLVPDEVHRRDADPHAAV